MRWKWSVNRNGPYSGLYIGNSIEYSMNTVKRWIAFPIGNLSPSLSERLRLYPETAMVSYGHIAPPPIARDCSRSFDTGHSRLKIFHHRMLRDRTLLSPSSLPSLPLHPDHFIFLSLHQRSRLALSFILPSSFFLFFFIFLQSPSHPISSSLSSPEITRQICGSGSRTQEDSLHLSFFLSTLSNAEDRYVPRGFGLTCLLQGGRSPERKLQQGLRDTRKGRWLSQQLPMV